MTTTTTNSQADVTPSLGKDTVRPEDMLAVVTRNFHGYIFIDGICFSLTGGNGVWHVGNGLRGKKLSCLSLALDEFLRMLSAYGVTVLGTKRLWALHIARAFRKTITQP
jgi:hypothetical protein